MDKFIKALVGIFAGIVDGVVWAYPVLTSLIALVYIGYVTWVLFKSEQWYEEDPDSIFGPYFHKITEGFVFWASQVMASVAVVCTAILFQLVARQMLTSPETLIAWLYGAVDYGFLIYILHFLDKHNILPKQLEDAFYSVADAIKERVGIDVGEVEDK